MGDPRSLGFGPSRLYSNFVKHEIARTAPDQAAADRHHLEFNLLVVSRDSKTWPRNSWLSVSANAAHASRRRYRAIG